MTVIIDTREKTPFNFSDGVATVRATLPTGDYSIAGLERLVAIERKSLPDLIGSVTRDRARFERELHRLQAYRFAAVIIEAELSSVYAHAYRSKATPSSILGSCTAFHARYGVGFVWAGDHAADQCQRLLRAFYRDCQSFAKATE